MMTKKSEKKTEGHEWIKIKPAELEKIIVELARKGLTSAKIGLVLRDQHGIPKAKILGKRITEVLKENKLTIKTDYEDVEKKVNTLKKHISTSAHDYKAKRALITRSWLLNKLKNLKEMQEAQLQPA